MFGRAVCFVAALSAAVAFVDVARAEHYFDDKWGDTWEARQDSAELRNAQRLVLLLSKGRHTGNAAIFAEASSQFYAGFSTTLARRIRQLLSLLDTRGDLTPQLLTLKRLLLVIQVTQASSAAANELLKYQVATTPNKITAFYAEAKGVSKISEVPGISTAWVIKPGSLHKLTFSVRAHIPGSKNVPMITPAGIASRMLYAIKADKLGAEGMLYGHLKQWVKEAVVAGFHNAGKVLGPADMLDYGFRYSNEWLNSDDDFMKISESHIGPIEIGDIFSIEINQNYNHSVIEAKPVMQYHFVSGKQKGEAAFLAGFTDSFKSIVIDGHSQLTHHMFFRVVGDHAAADPECRPVNGQWTQACAPK